ncbi:MULTISPECIES: FcoT family thioesterase [unclassified Micromonospora]|uniref:FcoT family thioesterase n=1 Tax=unclassified Micromonospora TaxID=2617518 RepID=UPI003624D8B2
MNDIASPLLDRDAGLRDEVLRCYLPHCRYLTSMALQRTAAGLEGHAELTIGESCYIQDTGHLNAVEAMIGYNQMLYYGIARAVRDRLDPVFATWSMADFRRRQLADILIVGMSSTFRSPIDRSAFSGAITLRRVRQRRLRPDQPPLISLDTAFRFWDRDGGACSGQVDVAVVVS